MIKQDRERKDMPTNKSTSFVCVMMTAALIWSSFGVGLLSAPAMVEAEAIELNDVSGQMSEGTPTSTQKPGFNEMEVSGDGYRSNSYGGWSYDPASAPANWSFRDAHNVPQTGYTGEGVTVAVADTGIDFGLLNLAGKYMVDDDPESPYHGWPVAFDAYGLPEFILAKEARPDMGGIANTTLNGTGPFDIEHTIKVDGQKDFTRNELVSEDKMDDVKTSGTASGYEFDLTELWATRDADFWYAGLKTRYGAMNRTFGFALDFDGPASGSIDDPHGNLLDFEASHSAPIEQVSYSPIKNLVASCAASGSDIATTKSYEVNSVKIWDVDGALVRALPNEQYPVFSAIWNPNGTLLAYETTMEIVVYETNTWTEVHRVEHSSSPTTSYYREAMSFSPDGTVLAAGSIEATNRIQILNVVTGETLRPLVPSPAMSVVFSPDGTSIALGLSNGKVQLINSTNYQYTGLLESSDTSAVETLAWDPDMKFIATGRNLGGQVEIWNLTNGNNSCQWGDGASVIENITIMNNTGNRINEIDRFFFRGIPNEVNVSGIESYQISTNYSQNLQYSAIMPSGQNFTWGMRVWVRNPLGTEDELTGGAAEAIVYRNVDGSGIQQGVWTPPNRTLSATDSLVIRIYQGSDVPVPDQLVTEFTTHLFGNINGTIASLNSSAWRVNYFTRRNMASIETAMAGHDVNSPVNTIKWTDSQIISGSDDGTVIFWNPVTFTATSTKESRYNSPVLSLDIKPGTGELFVGTQDCTVRKYPATWTNEPIPFAAHKPDIMIYIRYEREYYNQNMELTVFDEIGEPDVYKWNGAEWLKTTMDEIFGKSFYKGNLAGEWTEHGFIEIALPRNFTAYPDQYEMYINAFICGDNASRPQDTVPSDCNVPSVNVDWSGTRMTTLSAWGKVEMQKVALNHSAIASVRPLDNRSYHFGYHPSGALTNLFGSALPMIVTESATAGIWDRVYVDMNLDYVIDSNDPFVDKDNPLLTVDIWDYDPVSRTAVPGEDGVPDISGGLLYFIADGENLMPYSERVSDILVDAERVLIPFGTTDNPWNIPRNGEVVAFFGDFDYDSNQDIVLSSGTKMASAIAGSGLTEGLFSPIEGVSPNITFLPICNAHYDLPMALYFAVEGYDGIPNSGDEAQIVSVGPYVTGYGNGLDSTTQFVEYQVSRTNNSAVFISPAGNDGSGYGTVAAPCGTNTLVVGFAEDNTFIASGGDVHHFGQVSELSSRGPTAAGLAKPDVIALGIGEVDTPLVISKSLQNAVGGKSQEVWKGSEMATAVTTGVMALIFESYAEKHGGAYPSTQVAMDIIRSSATDLGYDPLAQGAGFVDALAAVRTAKNEEGLVISAQKTSFGNTFGSSYDSFINVLAPGENSALPMNIQNPTNSSKNVNYGFEYMTRTKADEMTQIIESSSLDGFKGDISGMVSIDAELVKVTAQTDYVWTEPWVNGTGVDVKDFASVSGSFFMKLWDWVDAQSPGDPKHGIIDTDDDLSYLTGVDYGHVNSMICTLSNPHRSLAGKLVVEIKADMAAGSSIPDRPWKITVESFVTTSMDWFDTSKTAASIAGGNTDTVNLNVDVPADAQSGTYSGAFVASYGIKEVNWTQNITPAAIDAEFLTSWNAASKGNYWDGDITTPHPIDYGKFDYHPLATPADTYSTSRTPMPPILIVGNANFTEGNGVLRGDGSVADPYIIENYDIGGTTHKHGIEIMDTDAHFIIRNCAIHGRTDTMNGISMNNVTNGVIRESEVYTNTGSGIYILDSNGLLIENNRIEGNDQMGIVISGSIAVSSDIIVQDNDISLSVTTILLSYANNITIIGNDLHHSALGMELYTIVDNLIAGNSFHNISMYCMYLYGVQRNEISSNWFDGFSDVVPSLWLDSTSDPVGNATINNIISGNDFVNCVATHAYDDDPGATNNWTGNYWGGSYGINDGGSGSGVADNAQETGPVASARDYYVPRVPITIEANAGFTPANGVVSGNGSEPNPYVIAGWGLNNSGSPHAILIQDTTAHFVIMDCLIYGNATGSGIILSNVANGTVRSNEFHTLADAIHVEESIDFSIIMNNIHDSATAIHVLESELGMISYNDISSCIHGIYLQSSTSCELSCNQIAGNALTGIFNEFSDESIIKDNTIIGVTKDGIHLKESGDCELTFNNLTSNGYGIHLSNATGINELNNNNFFGNTVHACDDFTYEQIVSLVKLPNTRVTDINVEIVVMKPDGSIEELGPGNYTIYQKAGMIEMAVPVRLDQFRMDVDRAFYIWANYTYFSNTGIVPITLNVMASTTAEFSFGDMNATETPNIMPVWGLRAGQGNSLESGDRRYFYVNVPNQGRFGPGQAENFYLYTELMWGLNRSDINIVVYGKGGAPISGQVAPYVMSKLGGSEEKADFSPTTATGGPKDILVTSFNHEILAICVSSKTFNGSGDSLTRFEGRGGWLKLGETSPKTWTNSLVGSMDVSIQSNLELSSGIYASIVGPAQGARTTEDIYQDDLSLYDLSTMEGWLTMNAVAGFTKVFTVENALSWDVHIFGDATCPDLDLAVFMDGLNGQPKDGIAQWQEIITQDDMDFESYGQTYGTGRYAYSADADADEAIKFISPPNGDYIVKVLAYTVNAAPGHFDLEVKTIFAGVEGYKLLSVNTQYTDENATSGTYLNASAVKRFDVRTFNVLWSFPEDTKDDVYGGIFVLGIPEAPQLLVFSIDIVLDREAPLLFPDFTGPNSIVSNNRPTISAKIEDFERGEIDPNGAKVIFDGVDITSIATISIPLTENSAELEAYWSGNIIYKPAGPLSEGGHNIFVEVKDKAGNARSISWGFTVDTTRPFITINGPVETINTNSRAYRLEGATEASSTLSIAGVTGAVRQRSDNTFTIDLELEEGANLLTIRSTDQANNVHEVSRTLILDTQPSTFKRVVALDGTTTNRRTTGIYGEMSEPGSLQINGMPVRVNSDGTFRHEAISLIEGRNPQVLAFTDLAGNVAYNYMNITLDTAAPVLTLTDIDATVYSEALNITGKTEAGVASLTINGWLAAVDSAGNFQQSLRLSPGTNTIVVETKDRAGNSAQEILTVNYVTDTGGRNWGAIGLMIGLLIIGLILGILLAPIVLGLFGDKEPAPEAEVPPEGEDILSESGMPPEEFPEGEALPEGEAEPASVPDGEEQPAMDDAEIADAETEPIPAEESIPEELPAEPVAETEELPPEPAPAEEDPRIAKLTQAYESGKISKELYEKNLAKFKGQ
ncbi:MAG: right-handed parallel beta-helix repeat-containing protein [Thermoplasmata archaeon]